MNKEIVEGSALLKVPTARIPEEAEVFYNPVMAFDRNISVGVVSVSKPKEVFDALSASGVRAIRYAKECAVSVWANDANPKATKLIKENVRKSKTRVKTTNTDANVILRQNRFEFVDIDPFGSPAPFLDSAAQAFWKRGHLALTATDTAPLSGAYPQVALRRYGVRVLWTPFYSELGVRVLITSAIRTLAKYEFGFFPQLSYARKHYFRVYGRVAHGNKSTDEQLGWIKPINFCKACGWWAVSRANNCPACKQPTINMGVYSGPLQDINFCEAVSDNLLIRGFNKEGLFVRGIADELDAPLYHNIHYVCKMLKREVPRLEKVIEILEKKGLRASRTHFCPTAIKTDADWNTISDTLKLS